MPIALAVPACLLFPEVQKVNDEKKDYVGSCLKIPDEGNANGARTSL